MKESNYGESTEVFLLTTQSNGRNKFGIANFLMRETKKSPAEAGQKQYHLLAFFLIPTIKSLSFPSKSMSNILGILSLYFASFSVSERAVK